MKSSIINYRLGFIWLASTFILLFASCKKNTHDEMAGPDEYFTCSMDPQVIENKAGNCPICHMKLIKVKRNNLKAGQLKLSAQQIKLGNIEFDTIRMHDLAKEIVLTGKIAVDQNLTNSISSKVAGRIEKLEIRNSGDFIRKGQLLYEIYSEELASTQNEFILATQQASMSDNFSEAAKHKLLLYGMSEAQINKLRQSKEIYQYVPVYSSQDGFVSEISISEGSYVSTGTTLFRITSLNSLWVEVQVYMPYLPYISMGTEALISVPAAGEISFNGKVIFMDPQVQSSSRFVLARLEFANPSQNIKPGMLANIILQTEKKKSLTLPLNAIIQDSKGTNVWVRNSDGVFENRMVTVGMQNSREIEILEGLNENDVVVVQGAYLLNSEYVFKKGANPMEGHGEMKGMKM
ncbi:MAG: efflux RND transporter periplasmic adaptor subunit [Bacteroidia bacterium]|jgi:Cu(I)/Ag(I) efflux system membrane fusion protein|nr:efflux RND transporter periplasmic adaptor subunit [Bacteroidia bacterium]